MMNRKETPAHKATNIHPNYRFFALSHIRQLRMMMREGRYISDCKKRIKDAQKDAANKRIALNQSKGMI